MEKAKEFELHYDRYGKPIKAVNFLHLSYLQYDLMVEDRIHDRRMFIAHTIEGKPTLFFMNKEGYTAILRKEQI